MESQVLSLSFSHAVSLLWPVREYKERRVRFFILNAYRSSEYSSPLGCSVMSPCLDFLPGFGERSWVEVCNNVNLHKKKYRVSYFAMRSSLFWQAITKNKAGIYFLNTSYPYPRTATERHGSKMGRMENGNSSDHEPFISKNNEIRSIQCRKSINLNQSSGIGCQILLASRHRSEIDQFRKSHSPIDDKKRRLRAPLLIFRPHILQACFPVAAGVTEL